MLSTGKQLGTVNKKIIFFLSSDILQKKFYQPCNVGKDILRAGNIKQIENRSKWIKTNCINKNKNNQRNAGKVPIQQKNPFLKVRKCRDKLIAAGNLDESYPLKRIEKASSVL